jgi:uncharacterized LabA/DUF88 family protein
MRLSFFWTELIADLSRVALFIDGANLYATVKALGFAIDYKRLLAEFQCSGTLVRAYYYTAVIEDQEFSSIRPLVDWLDYNGRRPNIASSLWRKPITGRLHLLTDDRIKPCSAGLRQFWPLTWWVTAD